MLSFSAQGAPVSASSTTVDGPEIVKLAPVASMKWRSPTSAITPALEQRDTAATSSDTCRSAPSVRRRT